MVPGREWPSWRWFVSSPASFTSSSCSLMVNHRACLFGQRVQVSLSAQVAVGDNIALQLCLALPAGMEKYYITVNTLNCSFAEPSTFLAYCGSDALISLAIAFFLGQHPGQEWSWNGWRIVEILGPSFLLPLTIVMAKVWSERACSSWAAAGVKSPPDSPPMSEPPSRASLSQESTCLSPSESRASRWDESRSTSSPRGGSQEAWRPEAGPELPVRLSEAVTYCPASPSSSSSSSSSSDSAYGWSSLATARAIMAEPMPTWEVTTHTQRLSIKVSSSHCIFPDELI